MAVLKTSAFFLTVLPFSLGLAVFNPGYDKLWEEFKSKYGRNYTSEEHGARRLIWEKNVAMIAEHNIEADEGLQTYWLEINKFTDWTIEEKLRLRGFHTSKIIKSNYTVFSHSHPFQLPSHVDWREKGYVTPVKDQGDCGSCWAFSSTGSLEGQVKAKTGSLVSLSEQNLVDCSWKQGDEGCNGGWMDYAFQYVIKNKGIDTEEGYPYKGEDKRCRFNSSSIGATCKSYIKIKEGSESVLQTATATIGPISVAIDASGDKFMFYKKGIYYDPSCSSSVLDHAVLVVGYGSQKNVDYWIVKNSWADTWGMNGYILMSRNAKNQCGIASHALYPVM